MSAGRNRSCNLILHSVVFKSECDPQVQLYTLITALKMSVIHLTIPASQLYSDLLLRQIDEQGEGGDETEAYRRERLRGGRTNPESNSSLQPY